MLAFSHPNTVQAVPQYLLFSITVGQYGAAWEVVLATRSRSKQLAAAPTTPNSNDLKPDELPAALASRRCVWQRQPPRHCSVTTPML